MEEGLMDVLKLVAPGTAFREGLEHILRAKTGALIAVGDSEDILGIVDGGFNINCPLTPARMYELAKMDGALVLSKDTERILIANAQLIPDPSIASFETGTRHRTAERVARQTGKLVVCISKRRDTVTLYRGNLKYMLEDIRIIFTKGNQAIQTLEKYRTVLDQALANLNALEFDDMVTLVDVTTVLQRIEMILRIQREVEGYISELGNEGRLFNMQLEELISNVREEGNLIIRDYINEDLVKDAVSELDLVADDNHDKPEREKPEKGKNRERDKKRSREHIAQELMDELVELSSDDLLNLSAISKALGYGSTLTALDASLTPRGYRLLRKIPRLPMPVIGNLVKVFGDFQSILNATIDALDEVDGIGAVRAKAIKDGLRHLRDRVVLERRI